MSEQRAEVEVTLPWKDGETLRAWLPETLDTWAAMECLIASMSDASQEEIEVKVRRIFVRQARLEHGTVDDLDFAAIVVLSNKGADLYSEQLKTAAEQLADPFREEPQKS